MNERLLALLTLASLAATPALAADRLSDTDWYKEEAPSAPRNAWHFSLAAGLGMSWDAGLVRNGDTPAASLELAVGNDINERWSLEGVGSLLVGVEGGFSAIGIRPLYRLSDHLDVGLNFSHSIEELFSADGAWAVGPHLGFRAGAFYAFYEPLVVAAPGGRNPFDNEIENSTGVALVPLRFGIGVLF